MEGLRNCIVCGVCVLIKKFFKRHIIPNVLAILFDVFCMWGFQLRCSSIFNPKKLNSLTFSILSELIFISDTKCSMFV